jgi:hypothetical protein
VIGKGLGNVTMGEKRQEKVSLNPGPGEYDLENASKLQTREPQVIIGT